ncbi:MAG: D-inositol-3-phosphate glycosyltransferase [Solirubrobacteraceae bacterium]|nr:D-inositol-3-phosphate glycosyltransferase [Solirubrobacteraceae bacterium]
MVSPFPPSRGGIAAYAGQAVARLREQGHEVVVASPVASDAEHVLDVTRRGAGPRFVRLARACDHLVVQFQPEMLGPPGSTMPTRGRALLRLAAGLWAAPSSELCMHEVNYGEGPAAAVLRRIVRRVWALADELTVHTERERREFVAAFGIPAQRIRVVSQGRHMQRRTAADGDAARAALGIGQDHVVLLAIGFLQPNKGFDRAIRAFAGVRADGGARLDRVRLYVAGALWREDAALVAHRDELRALAAATPGVELREGYLSDEDFDRWIVACDALVLPYRLGWSSNVMERGLLYDRPVIMSRVGGMAEQGENRPGVTLVDDDDELAEAVRRVVEELRRR